MNGKKIIKYLIIIFATVSLAVSLAYITRDLYTEYTFISPKLTPSYIDDFLSQSNTIDIAIVGDMMLDRNVRNIIDRDGFDKYFQGVRDIIENADIAIANLEGPFTTNESLTSSLINKTLQFTFDPDLAPKLHELGFDILGLANNHSMNFGKWGYDMTKEYIRKNNMLYYGDPNNNDEISVIIEKEGIKIALIGFHEFTYINFDKVLKEIERLDNEVDIIIVTPHWGIEYEKAPTEKMKKWAYDFIDSGADAVIGTHTHVIGDIEYYKYKKIYYSLGNFAFDQYFREETMKGLIVDMKVKKDYENRINIEYIDIPIRVDKSIDKFL